MLWTAPAGTKADEPGAKQKNGHERVWTDVKTNASYSKREGFLTDTSEGVEN